MTAARVAKTSGTPVRNGRLACLPLDDRPVNYDLPRELAAIAGLEIELPPREWLVNPWRSSKHAELVDWLEKAAAQADALLVALDTLGYGGSIPRALRRNASNRCSSACPS